MKSSGRERVAHLVELVNEYKFRIEFELVFDSPNDFLYRQNGQLKLSNSIIEEFLPDLVHPAIFPALADLAEGEDYECGPFKTFVAASFPGQFRFPSQGAGLSIRTKDHDFTIGKDAWLKASVHRDFPPEDTVTAKIYLAFLAAECKTNLDKTMFQEAAATAHDLRVVIPGARYYLLCEWLDMPPISTAGTDIQEAIILRGKRPGVSLCRHATVALRQADRERYRNHLVDHPILTTRVDRFVDHLEAVIEAKG